MTPRKGSLVLQEVQLSHVTFLIVNETQIVVDDEHGPLGPGGTRALMTAIMGTGQVCRAEVL